MDFILIIASCAALSVYFDADKYQLKPVKWCVLAFISCCIVYYITSFIVVMVVVLTDLYTSSTVKFIATIFTYAVSLSALRPISKRMKEAAIEESESHEIMADCE
jgi:RsiW-degrading membrane proteinase PrsW (M82 family)